jgi:hypothetical protein
MTRNDCGQFGLCLNFEESGTTSGCCRSVGAKKCQ